MVSEPDVSTASASEIELRYRFSICLCSHPSIHQHQLGRTFLNCTCQNSAKTLRSFPIPSNSEVHFIKAILQPSLNRQLVILTNRKERPSRCSPVNYNVLRPSSSLTAAQTYTGTILIAVNPYKELDIYTSVSRSCSELVSERFGCAW